MKNKTDLLKTVLKALEPVKKISCSEWAEKYFVLPSTSAEPGKYHISRTPYAKEILDAFTQPDINKVVVMSSSQISKTTLLLIVLARFIHVDPCNILIVMPTLDLAEDFSKDRLNNMIQDCKIITPLFYGEEKTAKTRDKTQTMLSKFFKGGRLVLVGANSPRSLASRPIRLILADEIDGYSASAGSEGDPIGLVEQRQTTYWNKITGLFSTPTIEGNSRIEEEYLLGTQEQWQHQCPNCKEYHALNIDDFSKENKWRCPDCGFEFNEREIKSASQKFVSQNPGVKHVRSFWINAFSSPWLSWEEILNSWRNAKGDETREQVIVNTRFGRTYKPTGEYESENIFLERREIYQAEIPDGVLLLTAAVDVQKNRLEYEIAGWNREERWGIMRGIVKGDPTKSTTWADLDFILDREYTYADGRKLKITRTFVDSGYNTQIVYEYCRQSMMKGRYAIKGKGTPGLALLSSYSRIKDFGIILTTLGVNDGKQAVYSKLSIEPGNEGYWHFPENSTRGYDERYFQQLISEKRVVRQTNGVFYMAFENIGRKRNESLDLACYNWAAMKSLNIDWNNFFGDFKKVENKKTAKNVVKNSQVEIY